MSEQQFIKIGFVTAPHALKGEVKVKPTSSFVDRRFKAGTKVYFEAKESNEKTSLTIKSVRAAKDLIIVAFKSITSIEEAEPLIKGTLYLDKNDAKLPKGFIYLDELLNMSVVLEDGKVVGVVVEILDYASYSTLRIKLENGKTILVPYIEEFFVSTDLDRKMLVFSPIEGML